MKILTDYSCLLFSTSLLGATKFVVDRVAIWTLVCEIPYPASCAFYLLWLSLRLVEVVESHTQDFACVNPGTLFPSLVQVFHLEARGLEQIQPCPPKNEALCMSLINESSVLMTAFGSWLLSLIMSNLYISHRSWRLIYQGGKSE